MADTDLHLTHRKQVLEQLAERSAAGFFPTAAAKTRNHDSQYRYRPDSSFWYLTGFDEPEACLVLLPARARGSGKHKSLLFLRDKDRRAEIWSGRRLGVEAAPEALGVDRAYPIGELWKRLPELLTGYHAVVAPTGLDADVDRKLLGVLADLRSAARSGETPPLELLDPAPFVHEARLIKNEGEIERMRHAAVITTEAHLAAMRAARPGLGEHEIDALFEYTFRRRGSTGPAYTNIVAGGANACILHYVRNDRPLKDGELLLVDAGAEWEYYASDATRTFPVNGTFEGAQRELYEVVLEAQVGAVERVRPGATLEDLHDGVVRTLCAGLLELGLLDGELDELIETGAYRRFYLHRTSHWLGLDVHDCGSYVVDGQARVLQPGMVLTVEPGLYIAPDEKTVEARWRGIGIRIEDDVLVTAKGHEVLTAGIPKKVEDVEAACRA